MRIRVFKVDIHFTLGSLFLLQIFLWWGIANTGTLLGGLAVIPLALLSLLAHEFMHVFCGRAFGIECKKIVVQFFGLGALLEHTGKKPKETFLIAAAGPATSFLLGFCFLALAHVMPSFEGLAVILNTIGVINMVLGIFNTFPLYPLDGGRMTHALFWKLTGDEQRGRVQAVRVSKIFIIGFLGALLFSVIFGSASPITLIWPAIVASILWNIANQEVKQSQIQKEAETVLIIGDLVKILPEPEKGLGKIMAIHREENKYLVSFSLRIPSNTIPRPKWYIKAELKKIA